MNAPEEATSRASELHDKLDEMKQWSLAQAAEYRALARVLDESEDEVDIGVNATADELRRIARVLESVHDRIDDGDKKRVRGLAHDDI